MIERIEDMPAGTVGLRASGKLSRDDYRDVLEPALRAWAEDAKTGLAAWFGHHSAWRRFALVTDVEWVAKTMHMFAWMTPGEVRIYEPGQLADAKSWAAG